ncbi:MAG: 16S rRNA (cytosine(1402)-N(4))-methyltransferase RsmH [Bacteroidetes bacterium]|nr:16S rRNA (cytosine(1402)-N(4))-methyltransferase RsmH [Bacteroidota bacterium]
MSNHYHIPVLLQACIDHLNIKPDGVYVDITFGGGGHSKEILKHLGPQGKLYAFDQDADAARNVPDDMRLTFIPQNFRFIKNYLRLYGVTRVDGILGDLGVSSHQFDKAERGFSTRFDADLDMRMNQQSPLTAKKVLNTYDEKKLIAILKEYGEVDNAYRLVKLVTEARIEKQIETISEFKEIIKPCTPRYEESRYLAKVFQALRIEVNGEMEVLKECLSQCEDLLNPGGRLVIMSYHSLEDRLVKNLMKTGNIEGKEEKDFVYGNVKKHFKIITGKPIVPAEEEIALNSRARSAKLRVAEKI